MTIVAIAALAVAAIVVALWIVTTLRRSSFAASDLRAKDAATFHIPAAVVPAEPVILGDVAPIDAEALLGGVPPAQAPSVDLKLLGLADNRDDVDREIWRTIHEHLSRKAASKGKS